MSADVLTRSALSTEKNQIANFNRTRWKFLIRSRRGLWSNKFDSEDALRSRFISKAHETSERFVWCLFYVFKWRFTINSALIRADQPTGCSKYFRTGNFHNIWPLEWKTTSDYSHNGVDAFESIKRCSWLVLNLQSHMASRRIGPLSSELTTLSGNRRFYQRQTRQ